MPRIAEARPAPGDLARVQAFVNTETPKAGDQLTNPRRLANWLARHRLLADGVELSDEDLRRALEVRWAIRSLVFATTARREIDPAALDRLQQATVGAAAEIRFDDTGPNRFGSARRNLADALGALLAAIVAAKNAGQWSLLKLCAANDCRRAFYDASQSRNGKWCTARCGDRVRAAAYRRTDWYQSVFKK